MKTRIPYIINKPDFYYDVVGKRLEIINDSAVYITCCSENGLFIDYQGNVFFFNYSKFKNTFHEIEGDKNMSEKTSQDKISEVLEAMKDLLLYKNKNYGDSALHPNNVFYKGDSKNSILIRLDDKLGRIKNNQGEIRTNDVCDLIGYLTLLLVSMDVDAEKISKLKD